MKDSLLFYYNSSLKLWSFHPSKQEESLEILTTSTRCSQWTNLGYYLLLFCFWNSTFACPVGIFSNSRRERMNAGSIRNIQMWRSTLTWIQAHPILDLFGYSNALVYSSNLLVHMFNRYIAAFSGLVLFDSESQHVWPWVIGMYGSNQWEVAGHTFETELFMFNCNYF